MGMRTADIRVFDIHHNGNDKRVVAPKNYRERMPLEIQFGQVKYIEVRRGETETWQPPILESSLKSYAHWAQGIAAVGTVTNIEPPK